MAVKKGISIIVLLSLLSFSALSAGDALSLRISSFRVLKATSPIGGAKEILETVANVAPGDIVEWQLVATNSANKTVRDVVLLLPIPAGTSYIAGTASSLRISKAGSPMIVVPEFSYDNGRTFGRPPLLKSVQVTLKKIKVNRLVKVDPVEYTHARWVLPILTPNSTIKVSLRTKVN